MSTNVSNHSSRASAESTISVTEQECTEAKQEAPKKNKTRRHPLRRLPSWAPHKSSSPDSSPNASDHSRASIKSFASAAEQQQERTEEAKQESVKKKKTRKVSMLRKLVSFGPECPSPDLPHNNTDHRRASVKSASSSSAADPKRAGGAERGLLLRRLEAARQIACGMQYLHSRRIIYRDLKPDNVGFDAATGDVKIFDFGLARFLPEDGGGRLPTGMAGTPRYMAPEVHRCRNYGLPADEYSYGLVLWEMLALERPFDEMSAKELQERVVYGGERPKVNAAKWPGAMCGLMERCWAAEPQERPGLGEVICVLDQELEHNEVR